ncbi:hypothetical protein HZC30_02810 [Candidatus Woesearchaeota archaeon]|nr:hypothetical protein [Candidatus Woesearchaeota archaeon]
MVSQTSLDQKSFMEMSPTEKVQFCEEHIKHKSYAESCLESQLKDIEAGTAEPFGNGIIRRYEGVEGKGYRFSNPTGYAIYDILWQKVSDHYLIQQQERIRNLRMKGGVKPMMGPYPVEILEGDLTEGSIDQRCLEILKKNVDREANSKYTI